MANTLEQKALLLTQYEQYGTFDYEQFLIDEYLLSEIDESCIGTYNEYLSDNCYEEFLPFDEETLKDYFCDRPLDLAKAIYFGDVCWSDEYFRFNGVGNIETFSDYRIVKEMKEDTGFLKWVLEDNYIELYEDMDEVIEKAYELLEMGY